MKYFDVQFAPTADVKVYLAAAGAGKTQALIDDMTEQMKVYRPDEIAFVTFTRKGVENGIERAIQANPRLIPEDLVYFQTLHRMCFQESGLKHKNIIEPRDIKKFNELLGFKLNLVTTFDNQTDDDKMLQRYDAIRAGGQRGVFIQSLYDEERYDRLIKAYEAFKQENDLVDFYDCLTRFRDRGQPISNIKVAIGDEVQDFSHLQWEVFQLAFFGCEKIRVAGDDFQAIFSYSGSSPETLIHLAGKYPTVKLEQSHRLPRAVYRFVRGITDLISEKVEKDYVPARDVEGFVKEMPDRSIVIRAIRLDIEANGFLPNRWYLLFRANCFIAPIADLLESFAIPYHTSKGFMIGDRDMKRIVRYYNYRKPGFGSQDARANFMAEYNIENFDEDFCESGLIGSVKRYAFQDYVNKYGIEELERLSKATPTILLTTTYKVKGGEADYVAVFLDATRLVTENMMFDLDSELRVLYVACSRTRTGLYLVAASGRNGMDRIIELVKEQMK